MCLCSKEFPADSQCLSPDLLAQVLNSAGKQNKTEQNLSPLKSLTTLPEHLFIQHLSLPTSCYVNLGVQDPGIAGHISYSTSCGVLYMTDSHTLIGE